MTLTWNINSEVPEFELAVIVLNSLIRAPKTRGGTIDGRTMTNNACTSPSEYASPVSASAKESPLSRPAPRRPANRPSRLDVHPPSAFVSFTCGVTTGGEGRAEGRGSPLRNRKSLLAASHLSAACSFTCVHISSEDISETPAKRCEKYSRADSQADSSSLDLLV